MSLRFWPALSLVLTLTLGAVLLAQPGAPAPPSTGMVLSGADVGFRIDAFDGRKPVGTLVVKVDGRWVEPKSVPSMMLLQPVK